MSWIKGDESDPHKVIPISLNSYSILRDHHNTFSHLPLENYYVVTRSKTKAEGTQLPKVHRVDEAVNSLLKGEVQVKREWISKYIIIIIHILI